MTDEQKHSIGRALGRVPSGVFILTAQHLGHSTAMMASWVQQAGFQPPAVTVAVGKGRLIARLMRDSGRFVVSIVSDADKGLMKRYARGVGPNEDAFAGVRTVDTPGGVPALADALAWLDCKVRAVCDFEGDHDIFVGEIVAGQQLHDGAAFTHQRGNGFHY